MSAIVVNLFGGPGTGKSTIATGAFSDLKIDGVNAEYVSEFAKDLVWEDRKMALNYQHYVIGKQMWKVERVRADPEIELVITDSPILFGLIYGKDYSQAWEEHVVEVFKSWHTLNFFLKRDIEVHPYSETGRTQDLAEALVLDHKIELMLKMTGTPYMTVPIEAGRKAIERVTQYIRDYGVATGMF